MNYNQYFKLKIKLVNSLSLILIALIWLGCTNTSQEESSEEEPAESTELLLRDTRDLTKPGGFTSGIEGPAVSDQGNIYAVNFEVQGTIGEVSPEGAASLFVSLPNGSIGNGIRFLSTGEMLIADYINHNILMVNMTDKSISVWAHEPAMNQPNDLAITSKDVIFASDPNWKESTGNLWRIDPGGEVTLLESNMGTTNGVEVSPDELKLYVNESVQGNVWVYDLSENGEVSNKQLLIKFEDYGMDGMRCDIKGNLYITRHGKGTVAVVSPEGKLIKEINMVGKKPSNIAFGGPDGRTCYVTLQDRGNIETFVADHPGRAFRKL
ncbi:MAG: gluconolactonase [Cyclobacteriaceae bacterium]|nr:MAG: gluconolactonase [Cyclobacteriaceae bacterium]